ncbi:MAG: thiamine phosphate synthase [Planctomycetaceae bacterium]|jgi:thiamine-phosphate pyrophosphorylase|nr:thiamine phosphate synthase [Planctomycetaceae bacterium]
MRFDLTYAAFRVFDCASNESLPLCNSTEISAAKLLIALFKEEDCRAAQWLHDAGLSLGQFRQAFDLDTLEKAIYSTPYPANNANNTDNADNSNNANNANNTNNTDNTDNTDNTGNTDNDDGIARLEMPISAPSFQVGSYGIPAEAYSGAAAVNPNTINAVAAASNPNSATNIAVPTDPDGGNANNKYPQKRHNSQQNSDELTLHENNSANQSSKRYYSLFAQNSGNSTTNAAGIHQPDKRNHWFYLDDQPVAIAQLSPELETAIETINQQFKTFNRKDQKIPLANGGVRTIETVDNKYSSSQPIATEHLLLAVSLDSSDVGNWLSDHGLDSTTLREQIETLNNQNRNHDPNNQFDQQFDQNFDQQFDQQFAVTENSMPDESESDQQLSYKIYRLLDAAANRGREAVRVLEDYARFVIDDQNLTRRLKEFRHDLQAVLCEIDFSKRLAARATENDIGREIEACDEYCRNSAKNVIDANFARLQESLRSIEEFSKINHNEVSRRVERLRYQSYILHKEFLSGNICNDNSVGLSVEFELRRRLVGLIGGSRLYVLVDCMSDEFIFREAVGQIIAGGADVIQLRDKLADDRTLLSRGYILRELVGGGLGRVLFIMNDRPDLAVLVGADGVHVGQDDLAVSEVRRIIGNEYLVGVSTHNVDQARQAVSDGADYIGAGPVFESATKDFDLFLLSGIGFLEELCGVVDIPAFAIGGINEDNINKIIAAGFSRIAVSNAIKNATNPKQTTENLRNLLMS